MINQIDCLCNNEDVELLVFVIKNFFSKVDDRDVVSHEQVLKMKQIFSEYLFLHFSVILDVPNEDLLLNVQPTPASSRECYALTLTTESKKFSYRADIRIKPNLISVVNVFKLSQIDIELIESQCELQKLPTYVDGKLLEYKDKKLFYDGVPISKQVLLAKYSGLNSVFLRGIIDLKELNTNRYKVFVNCCENFGKDISLCFIDTEKNVLYVDGCSNYDYPECIAMRKIMVNDIKSDIEIYLNENSEFRETLYRNEKEEPIRSIWHYHNNQGWSRMGYDSDVSNVIAGIEFFQSLDHSKYSTLDDYYFELSNKCDGLFEQGTRVIVEKGLSNELETLLMQILTIPPCASVCHVRTFYNLACLYAVRGEMEKAIEFLVKSNMVQTNPSHVKQDSDLNPLRNHPSFIEMMEKV